MIRSTYIFISIIALLLFVSCENDPGVVLEQEPVVVNCLLQNSNIYVRSLDDPNSERLSESTYFEYENGRVISKSNVYGSEEYEYTNGLVSRILQKNDEGKISYFSEYAYDADKNIIGQEYNEITSSGIDLISDMEYIYDNQLLVESRFKHSGERSVFEYGGPDGYIASISHYDSNHRLQEVTTIEWDGKNHRFLNLNIPAFGSMEFPTYHEQNILSFTTIYYDESGDVGETYKGPVYSFLYNIHDFPIQREYQIASTINRTEYIYSNCN